MLKERIEREDCEADRERGDGSSNSTASPTAERQDAEQRRDHNNRPYNTLSGELWSLTLFIFNHINCTRTVFIRLL